MTRRDKSLESGQFSLFDADEPLETPDADDVVPGDDASFESGPGSYPALPDGAVDMAFIEQQLERWVAVGWLRPLDAHLARFVSAREPGGDPLVTLSAALVSHQLGRGHICLDLEHALRDPDAVLSLPPHDGQASGEAVGIVTPGALLAALGVHHVESWSERLRVSCVLGQGEEDTTSRPLVLEDRRLYLRRFWQHECSVVARLQSLMAGAGAVSDEMLARLESLFGDSSAAAAPDWQKVACAMALRNRLTVISGGPGTGKTTTVTRLLALLQESALNEQGRALITHLAAPTGKAAARLSQSLGGAVAALDVPEAVRASLPREATTLHRLLGVRRDSRHFRHDADHPLALDVLVVDEASMVDLELMASLLAALPSHARLILLGDRDQLASVEAGAVLGDLCEGAEQGRCSDAVQTLTERAAGQALPVRDAPPSVLADHVVVLQKSYRFHEHSGIGALARGVNHGSLEEIRRCWQAGFQDIEFQLVREQGGALIRQAVNGYREALRAMADGAAPEAVLRLFARFQVLCALRRGSWGVEGLNDAIVEALFREKLVGGTRGWYAGRPVMVTRNDPQLGLYNGDIGIAMVMPTDKANRNDASGRLRVFFPHPSGDGVRAVLPGRLGGVETAFAMTVHKSQGSEFERVLLVLPERPNPIMTRELVYTGITRARSHCLIMTAFAGAVESAALRQTWRASGVGKRLGA
ncbi:exodeoxyribonuclease V subunit alpha [Kushneria indalinina]|uniref:RecBCD enzyme subunit RecD n=1 Tax=Kushneria indalinina DSM 14324 TaxID=1122140 RepID=A0A3D9DYS4_9GAMM|nr:exodeoxyribonuclease V subunit alpha [Kushneria indalinina]REC95825.1 DNA helicase/exodeoxyribonuclease V alpha subunit [Kushneria indalinina DSM 14324]